MNMERVNDLIDIRIYCIETAIKVGADSIISFAKKLEEYIKGDIEIPDYMNVNLYLEKSLETIKEMSESSREDTNKWNSHILDLLDKSKPGSFQEN